MSHHGTGKTFKAQDLKLYPVKLKRSDYELPLQAYANRDKTQFFLIDKNKKIVTFLDDSGQDVTYFENQAELSFYVSHAELIIRNETDARALQIFNKLDRKGRRNNA